MNPNLPSSHNSGMVRPMHSTTVVTVGYLSMMAAQWHRRSQGALREGGNSSKNPRLAEHQKPKAEGSTRYVPLKLLLNENFKFIASEYTKIHLF